MRALRRLAYAVFGVACTHLVFGAIVRITGSGMGCGPHWPDCDGHLIPPLSRPDLIIEVTHRYLASVLLLSLIGLTVAAWRRRAEAGVGGEGGVLRMAGLATALGFFAAILGAVTVKFGNAPAATVAHWTVAMSLVATVAATVIRTGGLGGASARLGGASPKAMRATFAGAGLALVAVVMGGLTAKVQGGSVACLDFPLCGANPAVPHGAVHVQITHRVIAVLLVLHLVGVFFALRKRKETPVVRRAAAVALGLGVLQLLVAGAMIGMRLPPVLRSLHEATGVSIWIATFTLAYLARLASRDGGTGAERPIPIAPIAPVELGPLAAASVRGQSATPAPLLSTAATSDSPLPASGAVRNNSVARQTPSASALAAPAREARLLSAYLPPAEGRIPTPAASAAGVAAEPVVDVVRPAPVRPAGRDDLLELPAALAHATAGAARAAIAFHFVASTALPAVGGPPTVEVTRETVEVAYPSIAGGITPSSPVLPAAPLTPIAARRRPAMTHSVAVIIARGADV